MTKVMGKEIYINAINRRIFLGSILDDLWCLVRPSGISSAFDVSLRGGAVTGKVGNALDQKGSNALRILWRIEPTMNMGRLINQLKPLTKCRKGGMEEKG